MALSTESRLAAEMYAAGIEGYVVEVKGEFYIPVIIATNPGRGDCSRWLDLLPRDRTIKVPGVMNRRLAGMLSRRGFRVEREWAEEFGEMVEVYVRRPEGDRLSGVPDDRESDD